MPAFAASMRLGRTSSAAIEREVSMAIMIVASLRGTDISAFGLASPTSNAVSAMRRIAGGTWRRRPGSRSTTLGRSGGDAKRAATRDRRRWCTT